MKRRIICGTWLAALSLAACAGLIPPTKIADFQAQEVVWVYKDQRLMRCWQHGEAKAPVCMPAVVLRNPIEGDAPPASVSVDARADAANRQAAEARFIEEMNQRRAAKGEPLYTGDPFFVPDELKEFRAKAVDRR